MRGTEQFAMAYFDDLVVYSWTWEEHLREILRQLQAEGLTTKPKKCRLAMSRMPYLGYITGKVRRSKIIGSKKFSPTLPGSKTPCLLGTQ